MIDEELIEQILSVNNGISKEGLLKRLEGEKRKTGGLISNETLLRMIAAEFGLNLSLAEKRTPTLSISDLMSGLYDVTVFGRVLAVFPPRTFNGKKSGRLASLLIADRTGILRVVLWNHQIGLVESGDISVGKIFRFSHAYTKEDWSGKVELHVGSKCKVEICRGSIESDCPTTDQLCMRIGDISQGHKNKRVNVYGTAKNVFPASAFERQDLSTGKVMRFTLADETGEVFVVAWNEKADELEKVLKHGVSVQVVSGRVKDAVGGGLEVHVDGGTYVGLLESNRGFGGSGLTGRVGQR
jgi:ssDNA-binding replication factor A large subunit